MDSQRKIFAYLLVFISTGLFSSILVDANFDEKRGCLANHYVQYFENLKSLCNPDQPPPNIKKLIKNYKKALEACEPRKGHKLWGKKVKVVTDLEKFEATTKEYFNKIKDILKDRLLFDDYPLSGASAVIDLCKVVRAECIPREPTVELPLADELKRMFEEFNEHAKEEERRELNESKFAEHCQPASASHAVVDPGVFSHTPIAEQLAN